MLGLPGTFRLDALLYFTTPVMEQHCLRAGTSAKPVAALHTFKVARSASQTMPQDHAEWIRSPRNVALMG
jgi:hypothetical protein